MKKIFCEICKEEIELQPCYIGGKTICGKCYISEKFKNSHQQIYEKKLQEAEESAKRKKEEIKKKEKSKNKRLQRKKDIRDAENQEEKTKQSKAKIIIQKSEKSPKKFNWKDLVFLRKYWNARYSNDPKRHNLCECGQPKQTNSQYCLSCHNKKMVRTAPYIRNPKTGRFTCIS